MVFVAEVVRLRSSCRNPNSHEFRHRFLHSLSAGNARRATSDRSNRMWQEDVRVSRRLVAEVRKKLNGGQR